MKIAPPVIAAKTLLGIARQTQQREDVAPVRGRNVGEKPLAFTTGGTQRESQDHRDEEDTDGVVPVEQLESVSLRELGGIGPGAPADRAGDHHHHCDAERLWNEHGVSELRCDA